MGCNKNRRSLVGSVCKVQSTGQTSERNMKKYFFGDLLSAYKIALKSFLKICRS